MFYTTQEHEPEDPNEIVTKELKLRCHGLDDANAVVLRTPVCVEHIITNDSPMAYLLARSREEIEQYAAEVSVVVQGRVYGGRSCYSQSMLRMSDINFDHRYVSKKCISLLKAALSSNECSLGLTSYCMHACRFVNVVIPPTESESKKLEIDWSRFHETEPIASVRQSQSMQAIHAFAQRSSRSNLWTEMFA